MINDFLKPPLPSKLLERQSAQTLLTEEVRLMIRLMKKARDAGMKINYDFQVIANRLEALDALGEEEGK